MPLGMSSAAVCQCFTLVSLCTSIADPNWIQIKNASDPNGKQLIYGVAFTLHAAQNLTNTGPLGGLNGWGMWLLYTLAGLCYSAVLLSSSSFLMDFLGSGHSRPRLLKSLYILTAVFFGFILGVCGACMYIIHRNLLGGQRLWDWLTGGSERAGALQPWGDTGQLWLRSYPGESFYIAILGLVFSGVAAVLSVTSPLSPGAPASHGGYTAVVEVDEEDSGEGAADNPGISVHE